MRLFGVMLVVALTTISAQALAQAIQAPATAVEATTTEKEKIAILRGLAMSYLDSAVDSQAAVRSMIAENAELRKKLAEAEKKAEPKPADKPVIGSSDPADPTQK